MKKLGLYLRIFVKRATESVQIVRRDRVAVEVLKARARVFIKLEPEIFNEMMMRSTLY